MGRIVTLLILLGAFGVSAQNITDFSLEDVGSGKSISLSDYKSSKAVVLIFTSNICVYSVYYEGRVTQLIADYSNSGIQFLLINSNTDAKESKDEMANKINTWGLDVPYLADKDQKVMTQIGARKSPEAFILKPSGTGFTIYYSGAIDNNPQVATDVKNQYLKDNLNNLIKGEKATQGARPIGCMIK